MCLRGCVWGSWAASCHSLCSITCPLAPVPLATGTCSVDRPLDLAETHLGPPLSLGRERKHLGQFPTGLSIHFRPSQTKVSGPVALRRAPSAPTAECWPEVWATPSSRPGASWTECPHALQWPGSTFPCTTSAERLLTQQLESWACQYCQWGVGGRYQNLAAMPETKTRPRCRGRAQGSQAEVSQRKLDPY